MTRGREDLKMVISEVHRCKTIVADLLNFARQHEILASRGGSAFPPGRSNSKNPHPTEFEK